MTEYTFEVSGQRVRILVGDALAMDKTWITEVEGSSVIINGPAYLADLNLKKNQLSANAEYPLIGRKDGPVHLYLENRSIALTSVYQLNKPFVSVVTLAPWQTKKASVYVAPTYDDSNWFSSSDPQQMGADNNLTTDAWYRTSLDIPASGKYTMQVDGGDRATAFIDGKKATQWKVKDGEVTFDIEKDKHTLAVFTAHDGRDKLAAYIGSITDVDKKGLSGQVRIKQYSRI